MAARVGVEEVERRYGNVRGALEAAGLDAVVVAGSEYTGFEGAVTYLSGFVIVHRYAYVVLPREGEPSIVFPAEARYVGEHGTTWIDEQVVVDLPGAWIRERAREQGWSRVGVYGLDYIMPVRDYRVLAGDLELVPFDVEFDLARAVKSEEELRSVRESVRINELGFWKFLEEFEPGRTPAAALLDEELLAGGHQLGRLTMDMVLRGPDGSASPEFTVARNERPFEREDLVLPSLEVAGPGGHWVEVSRAICAGEPSDDSKRMLEAYEEYYAAARESLRPGATAHDVHRAVSRGFVERGYRLGHVTGHSIGMTMLEFPKIGEGVETELEANMVFSLHPHALTEDGKRCLYMQDTWLVTEGGGEPLADLPIKIFDGSESRAYPHG